MFFYPYPGWPYTAKAVIQYEYGEEDAIWFYLTFSQPMDRSKLPSPGLFEFTVNGVKGNTVNVDWPDEYTLRLEGNTEYDVGKVYLKYNGPNGNLRTSYKKQWEPWGYIPCIRIV